MLFVHNKFLRYAEIDSSSRLEPLDTTVENSPPRPQSDDYCEISWRANAAGFVGDKHHLGCK